MGNASLQLDLSGDYTDTRPRVPHSLLIASWAPFMIAVKMAVLALPFFDVSQVPLLISSQL